MPLINEAAYTLMEGVADAEAIDDDREARAESSDWGPWRSPT